MQKKNPLAIIFSTIFIDMLGVGILIPVIPQLLANPDSPDYLLPAHISLERGYLLMGLLIALFPIMQFFSAPILGQLSDKYGRKPILIVSLLGTALSYVGFAIGIHTRNLPLLIISRAVDGITGGNISVAQAAIADVTTPENRSKNFGLIGAAFGLGFILGPYIGGKVSDPAIISWFEAATPFWFAACLALANALSVMFRLPETHPGRSHHLRIEWGKSLRHIMQAARAKGLRSLFFTNFLLNSGFAFFTTFFSVFLISKFAFGQGAIGDFFAYIGIWIAFTQGVVTRFVATKVSERPVLQLSLIATGLFMLAFFLPRTWWGLLIVTPFFSMANGLTMANITGLISRTADQSIQGEVLGINSSIMAVAQAIPTLLAGVVAARVSATAPVVVGAGLIILAGLCFIALFREPQKVTVAERFHHVIH